MVCCNVRRGRLVVYRFYPELEKNYLDGKAWEFGPRLDFIAQVDQEYRRALEELQTEAPAKTRNGEEKRAHG